MNSAIIKAVKFLLSHLDVAEEDAKEVAAIIKDLEALDEQQQLSSQQQPPALEKSAKGGK